MSGSLGLSCPLFAFILCNLVFPHRLALLLTEDCARQTLRWNWASASRPSLLMPKPQDGRHTSKGNPR